MEKDNEKEKTDAAWTFDLIREVGDTLVPRLKLPVDLPELQSSNKCPMLDLQVWMDKEATARSGTPSIKSQAPPH